MPKRVSSSASLRPLSPAIEQGKFELSGPLARVARESFQSMVEFLGFDLQTLQNLSHTNRFWRIKVFVEKDGYRWSWIKGSTLKLTAVAQRTLANSEKHPLRFHAYQEAEALADNFGCGIDFSACVQHYHFLHEEVFVLGSLGGLRSLNMSSIKASDGGALLLLTQLKQLTSLDLRFTYTLQAGVKALAELTTLEKLNISDTRINNVTELSTLTRLQNLDWSGCYKPRISSLEHLTGLTQLNLSRSFDIPEDEWEVLTELKSLKCLKVFDVPNDTAFSHVKSLTILERLKVCSSQITDVSLICLQALPRLSRLTFEACKEITNKGFENVRYLTALQRLSVEDCHQVTKDCMGSLTALTSLRTFKSTFFHSPPTGNDLDCLSHLTQLIRHKVLERKALEWGAAVYGEYLFFGF